MDNGGSGKQSRLLGRLIGKLRGEHRYTTLDKNLSFTSTGMSESIGCGSSCEEEVEAPSQASGSSVPLDHAQLAANIDMRYSGQYLTPEQLPEFCTQLHHLVEVIRNIQSYAKVTGEYPSELERRLEREAREVAALAAEARNANEVATRAKVQRRALKEQRAHLTSHISRLRESEVRELESSVRLSDRKLYKNWEALKDSADPASFEPLLEEIRNKQTALECLVRLIEGRRAQITKAPTPHPLPPPVHDDDDDNLLHTTTNRNRHDTRRANKRRRKEMVREPRSVPLSSESSRHEPQQITLYISGGQCPSLGRAGSAGAGGMLELPRASVRDIIFFTT